LTTQKLMYIAPGRNFGPALKVRRKARDGVR
jgi:hypothetical protein